MLFKKYKVGINCWTGWTTGHKCPVAYLIIKNNKFNFAFKRFTDKQIGLYEHKGEIKFLFKE